jgi:glutamine amidotransferase
MNSRLPASLTLSFTGFSQRGGCTDHHSDGWGIAFFESDGDSPGKAARHFVDKDSAATSPIAQMLRTYPIKSHNVVAHVRKATVGAVRLENCHPFVRELWGHYWFFAHNGDLKDYAPRLHGSFKPVGTTDSEMAFCWIMQELNKAHAAMPPVGELSQTLAELAPKVAEHGTFNFLLSNGQALWAHASTHLHYVQRQYPFDTVQLKDEEVSVDLSELNGPDDKLVIVVTQPLTTNENWVAMAPGEMRVFKDGSLLPELPRSAYYASAASSASTNIAATSKPV